MTLHRKIHFWVINSNDLSVWKACFLASLASASLAATFCPSAMAEDPDAQSFYVPQAGPVTGPLGTPHRVMTEHFIVSDIYQDSSLHFCRDFIHDGVDTNSCYDNLRRVMGL